MNPTDIGPLLELPAYAMNRSVAFVFSKIQKPGPAGPSRRTFDNKPAFQRWVERTTGQVPEDG